VKLIRQFVGAITIVLVGAVFVLGDVLLWLTVVPAALVAPGAREPLLRFNARLLAGTTAWLMRLAGAKLDIGFRVPCKGGILIVANHQSLVDIVIAFETVPDGYPRMVAHHRYMRGIPLVSHMMRAYRHIAVYPGRTGRDELERLQGIARNAKHPIVIYPEGHRTGDGEVRPWKRAGLQAFLSARPWTVYVLVVDGLWKSARVPDFVRTVSGVRCRAEAAGPFEYDGTGRDDHGEFIDMLERVMCDKLAEMRRESRSSVSRREETAGSAVPS
jgi:1-acyl-sn-glycerol-3-phosphate acyltransferase